MTPAPIRPDLFEQLLNRQHEGKDQDSREIDDKPANRKIRPESGAEHRIESEKDDSADPKNPDEFFTAHL